ncbi:MAG TPA: ethanolamine ammonia-lyase reactivating factor EutA [Candidatus Binatia bacterium]|jgi:ethanolamine utilization protein EutA|nr:ethanolamine ammonia-lyase reactivating factor EutA [Candidatus Binatia bacterium]
MDSTTPRGSFSNANRHMQEEEELQLTTVGVDIGSSTSHLVFSRLELTLEGSRYRVTKRQVLNESEILLTPYVDETRIDVEALEAFINQQYKNAKIKRDEVDTGALILTGVAVRRRNARAIAELFAQEAGKFVAVSAGDGLEATMAAHGSGAVAHSAKTGGIVLNIDIGGGTSKFALCNSGKVQEVSAIDIGARLIAFDPDGTVVRIEESGRKHASWAGIHVALGQRLSQESLGAMASAMVDKLFAVVKSESLTEDIQGLLRLPPLSYRGEIDSIMFSGGVSEFIYTREKTSFGDLGPLIADEIHRRMPELGMLVMEPTARIRATVIGASQYTIQVSGNTIFITPPDAVPVRNVPVVAPEFNLHVDELSKDAVKNATLSALQRLDLLNARQPVAIAFHWRGSATFFRLQAFSQGVVEGLKDILAKGHPLTLVNDGDIGGIVGLHFQEELQLQNPIISIDGIALNDFDYIDIGALIPSSGAVPVVIKSLIFPASSQQ